VSLASARAAYDRLVVATDPLTPEAFLRLTDAELLAIGFSHQKARYGRALSSAILDGSLDLDYLASVDDEAAQTALESIPARRMGTPADIGAAVRFLASPAAGYVNGISMPVDAGAMLLQFRFARHTRYDLPT